MKLISIKIKNSHFAEFYQNGTYSIILGNLKRGSLNMLAYLTGSVSTPKCHRRAPLDPSSAMKSLKMSPERLC